MKKQSCSIEMNSIIHGYLEISIQNKKVKYDDYFH